MRIQKQANHSEPTEQFAKMFILVVLSCVVLSQAQLLQHILPRAQPYDFGYSVRDPHSEQHRQEAGNGHGDVVGNYGFTDARGIGRQVNYVADHGGFRAQVNTNEPGTANQNPAAVHLISHPHHAHRAVEPLHGHPVGASLQNHAPRVVVEPFPAHAPRVVVEPFRPHAPRVVVEPLPAHAPRVVAEPFPAHAPRIVVEPLRALAPRVVAEPLPAHAPRAVVEPLRAHAPQVVVEPIHVRPVEIVAVPAVHGHGLGHGDYRVNHDGLGHVGDLAQPEFRGVNFAVPLTGGAIRGYDNRFANVLV